MEIVNTTSTTDPVNMYNYLNSYILNPIVFIIIFLIIVAYFVFLSSLGSATSSLGNSSATNSSSSSSNIFAIIIIVIAIILVIVHALQYFLSINVTAYVQGIFTPKATVDIVIDQSKYQSSPVPEIKFKKQVFNIPGNYYNYENTKAVCQAYGADLASYDQIEKSYKGPREHNKQL